MRTNGSLRLYIPADGVENEYGEEEFFEGCWSLPIPCMIQTNSERFKSGMADGEYKIASYTVFVEESELPRMTARRIRLERNSEILGDFVVMSFELISSMGRMKIVVG